MKAKKEPKRRQAMPKEPKKEQKRRQAMPKEPKKEQKRRQAMPKAEFAEALKLFGVFFKIGLFTFGGGHAMIPLIKREIAEKRGYIEESRLLDMVAVCESTPGPVSVNMATYVGFNRAGFLGAALATFGVVLPSFIIILLISTFLTRFKDIEAVAFAFNGIRAAVLILVADALITLYRQCNKGVLPHIITALSFAAVLLSDYTKIKISVPIVIAAAAAPGLVSAIANRKKKGRGKNTNGRKGGRNDAG